MVDDAVHAVAGPAAPHHLLRSRVDDVEDERACFVFADPFATIVVAIAVAAIDAVHVDALIDARVIVDQQIRLSGRGACEPFDRHLLFHFALHVILEERILVEPRVAGRELVRRTPVVSVIPREVDAAVDMRAHAHRRRAAGSRKH